MHRTHVVSNETDPYPADITGHGAGWSIPIALVADIGVMRRDQYIVDIVIYEQDGLTRALLHQWLGEAGYRVHVGKTRDADPAPAADLVIVNVFMPKHAGAQWIRSIQAAHPNTPLIAISGQFRSGLSAAGATAQTLGVRQVIAKPLVRTDLLDAVRDVIGAPD
jgi:DNA-binding NtrC family response regulator